MAPKYPTGGGAIVSLDATSVPSLRKVLPLNVADVHARIDALRGVLPADVCWESSRIFSDTRRDASPPTLTGLLQDHCEASRWSATFDASESSSEANVDFSAPGSLGRIFANEVELRLVDAVDGSAILLLSCDDASHAATPVTIHRYEPQSKTPQVSWSSETHLTMVTPPSTVGSLLCERMLAQQQLEAHGAADVRRCVTVQFRDSSLTADCGNGTATIRLQQPPRSVEVTTGGATVTAVAGRAPDGEVLSLEGRFLCSTPSLSPAPPASRSGSRHAAVGGAGTAAPAEGTVQLRLASHGTWTGDARMVPAPAGMSWRYLAPHGHCTLQAVSQDMNVSGTFKGGLPDGHVSVTTCADASTRSPTVSFEGGWKGGVRDGKGVLSLTAAGRHGPMGEATRWEAAWSNGVRHGDATFAEVVPGGAATTVRPAFTIGFSDDRATGALCLHTPVGRFVGTASLTAPAAFPVGVRRESRALRMASPVGFLEGLARSMADTALAAAVLRGVEFENMFVAASVAAVALHVKALKTSQLADAACSAVTLSRLSATQASEMAARAKSASSRSLLANVHALKAEQENSDHLAALASAEAAVRDATPPSDGSPTHRGGDERPLPDAPALEKAIDELSQSIALRTRGLVDYRAQAARATAAREKMLQDVAKMDATTASGRSQLDLVEAAIESTNAKIDSQREEYARLKQAAEANRALASTRLDKVLADVGDLQADIQQSQSVGGTVPGSPEANAVGRLSRTQAAMAMAATLNGQVSELLVTEKRLEAQVLDLENEPTVDSLDVEIAAARSTLHRLASLASSLSVALAEKKAEIASAHRRATEAGHRTRSAIDTFLARQRLATQDAAALRATMTTVSQGVIRRDATPPSLPSEPRTPVTPPTDCAGLSREVDAMRRAVDELRQRRDLLRRATPTVAPAAVTSGASDAADEEPAPLLCRTAPPGDISMNASAEELKRLIAACRLSNAEKERAIVAVRKQLADAVADEDRLRADLAISQRRGGGPNADWRMRALQDAIEARDALIADMRTDARRGKQLEAKLETTQMAMSTMYASAEVKQQQAVSKARADQEWATAVAIRRNTSSTTGRGF